MDYKEQIKHPKWQKKRLEILERDKYMCVVCEDNESTLHVHHRWYQKGVKMWEYDNDCYQTLCKDCHQTTHDTKNNIIEIINKNYDNWVPLQLLEDILIAISKKDYLSQLDIYAKIIKDE